MPTKQELLEEAEAKGVEVEPTAKKADLEAALEEAAPAEHPDTPSGLGLQAAEGLEGDEAAEAYQTAKKQARWG